MRKICLLVFALLGMSGGTAYAQLVQDHPYQVTLRNYLAQFNEKDFEVELKPLELQPSYFSSAEDAYRAWLFFGHRQYDMMETGGLRVDASHFTLNNIEANGQVNMTVGKGQFMLAVPTAFYAAWDYEGNPHYNSRAVKLRAFVAAAVDMMMQDQRHEKGKDDRSDFAGIQLIRWAYPYGVIKDELPQEVRKAYEKGLIKMFERLEQWGPTGIHADMDMGALVGMLYTAKFVDSQDLQRRAERHIDLIFDKHLKSPGYIDHGSAYDAGYNGISAYFLNWAAQISDYRPIIEAVKKMSRLKAYLTLPDPDGREFSPFHSNSSSGGDAPHDYWNSYNREVGMARYSDDAVYLALSGGMRSVRSPGQMYQDLEEGQRLMNHRDRGKLLKPSDEKPGQWKHEHWIDGQSLNAAAMYMQDDLYSRLKSLQQSNSKLRKPPFARGDNFTENLGDKILSVKRQSYGTIIFNDRLSWWTKKGQTETINGFGGGNLSAFWTPSTGTVLLGGTRTNHNGGLDLKDWAIWPLHALSGETSDGRAFSSGIQRYPEADYQLNSSSPRVIISGDLTNIYSDPRDGLQGKAEYNRVFDIKDNGVEVTTSVIADGGNRIKSLYEILPVYLRHGRIQSDQKPTEIQFEVNGGWQKAGTTLKKVSRIRLQRFGGEVLIEFENPRQVKLSPETFYQDKNGRHGMNARNIMIKMGDSSKLENSSVRYFIRSSKAVPNASWGESGDNGGSGGSGNNGSGDSGDKGKGDSSGDDGTSAEDTEDDSGDDGLDDNPAENNPPARVKAKLEQKDNFLTAAIQNASDPDGDDLNFVYDWRVNGNSIAEVNVPFDVEFKKELIEAPSLKNYTSYQNIVSTKDATHSPMWHSEGRKGGASLFDGKNDFIRVSKDRNKAYREFSSFSVEAWIKHDGWGENWASIISKPYEKSSWKNPWVVFKLSRNSDNENLNFQITAGDEEVHSVKTKQNLPSDKWAHIVGTYDGKKLKIYINGVLDNEKTVNLPLADNPGTDIYIGKSTSADGIPQHYRGLLDEVRIFNVAISAEQVKQHYEINYNKISLDNAEAGQEWHASVSANDSKMISEISATNKLIIKSEDSDAGDTGEDETKDDSGGDEGDNGSENESKDDDSDDKSNGGNSNEEGNENDSGDKGKDDETGAKPADNTPPEVKITHLPSAPDETQEVTFTASASDDSDIKKIFIYLNGKTVKTCTGKNTCKLQADPFKPGSYKYSAKAIDNTEQANGAVSKSKSFKVTAAENDKGEDSGGNDKNDGSGGEDKDEDSDQKPKDNTPPEVKITHVPSRPDDSQEVTFTAVASDDSDIKSLAIILNGKTLKTCTGENTCEIVADPLKVGSHRYSAKAEDNSGSGNSAETYDKSFRVTPAPVENTPPVKVKVTLKREELFLTAEVENVSDPDGDDVSLVFDWRLNSNSIAEVNIPFDIDYSNASGDTGVVDNYSSFQNIVSNKEAAKLPKWSKEGRRGGASLFDGKNDFMRVSKEEKNETRRFRTFSAEAWIKHDGWGDDWASIISKPYAASSWKIPWAVFKLSRYKDTDNLNFQITAGDEEVHDVRTKQNLPAHEWTHIVGTYDGKKLKIYVNGVLDAEKTVNRPLADNPETDIYIGKSTGAEGISQHYRGLLDEVRVLNVAITPDQVKEHYKLNYHKIALNNARSGQEWNVSVSASDSKTSSEAVATSAVLLTAEDLPNARKGLGSTLVQNFPNPFRSSTTIPYSLEDDQDIEIRIYDSSGRLVDTVYKGSAPAGEDSKPFSPSQLSSGVYFYQLVTDKQTITKKMTYLK